MPTDPTLRIVSSRLLSAVCTAALLALCLTAAAQQKQRARPEPPMFRVGKLIENGYLGDPKGWELQGFVVEKTGNITRKKAPGPIGKATTTFRGQAGVYKLRIKYFDEGDGVSTAGVQINGKQVRYWQFDGILVDAWKWQEFDGLNLKPGDKLTITGRSNVYEYCRIAGVEILPGKAATAAAEESVAERTFSSDLVPLSDARDVRATDRVPLPEATFSGGQGAYTIYLKANDPLRVTFYPSFLGFNTAYRYSLTRMGAEKPIASGQVISPGSQPVFMRLPVDETGLYVLTAGRAAKQKGSVKLRFDCPGVTAPPVKGDGCFFVPKGTRTLGVKLGGRAVLLDASGKPMLDEWSDGKSLLVVNVPAGSDDQPWSFQGTLSALTGVPPHIAAEPAALLVPREVLEGGAR